MKIREAGWEDYAQIAALLTRCGLSPKTREEWEHLWINNPVYKTLTNWPIGWVAERPDQEIVGYVGNIPLSFEFRGRTILASSFFSLSVDSRYRGYAGFLIRRAFNYKVPELLVGTTVNPAASKILNGLRAARVPAGDWGQARFWITNYHGFVSGLLKHKGWPKLLSYPGSALLSLKDRFNKADSWMERNRREVGISSNFDERFEPFWDELRRARPERLLATRSREVLEWHFKYALAQKKVWIVTLGDNSRLAAYALFRRRDAPEYGLKRMQLVDFQALNDDPQALAAALAWALAQCRKEGIHTLEAFGFRSEKQAVIDSLAPYHRRLPSWWYFYKPVNKLLAAELRDPKVWDPSHFDGDTTL